MIFRAGQLPPPPRELVMAFVNWGARSLLPTTIIKNRFKTEVPLSALAQIPISTFSHIWVFVRQYGIMFVIIVIIIIIIIIYRKVKVSTLKHV